MLRTNLKQISGLDEFNEVIKSNKKVIICCGKTGQRCLSVFKVMENLEEKYENIKFFSMDYDARYAIVLKNNEIADEFISLPYTFYFKKGKVVKATESIQNKKEVETIIDDLFI